ncbi:MAG: PAS domain S-box protein [Candidatus Odinarchaeota archaeon]
MRSLNIQSKSSQDKVSILIVDDEPELLEMSKIYLERENEHFVVDIATSAENALEKLEKKTYNVVVSDYQMPGTDGLGFLEALRKRNNTIPFIMFTGRGREEVAIRALNLGANRYIQKGGDLKSLYSILSQAINREAKHSRAEEELRDSEERYRLLVENMGEGMAIVDFEENILFANPAAEDIFGIPRGQLVGRNLKEFLVSEMIERVQTQTGMRATGKKSTYELEISRPDGQNRQLLVTVNPYADAEGNIVGAFGISRDITARKKSVDELVAMEHRFHQLADELPYGLTIIEQGKVIYVNNSACEILGRSREELIDSNGIYVDFSEKKEYLTRIFEEEKLKSPSHKELKFWISLKDGSRRFIQNYYFYGENKAETNYRYVITTDITDQGLIDEQLKETLKELGTPTLIIDSNHKVVEWNTACEDLTGINREDIVGSVDAWKGFYDNQRPILADLLIDQRIEEISNYYTFFEKAKHVSEGYTAESWVNTKKGKKYLLFTAVPIRDIRGNITGAVETLEDITDRRQAEERESFLHTLLRHDLNNKIQAISGYLDLMNEFELSTGAEEIIENIYVGIEESQQLITKVGMLRQVEVEKEGTEVNLASFLLNAIKKNLDKAKQKGIAIDYSSDGFSYRVFGGLLLEELFHNLIENSIKHAGCSTIKVSAREENERILIIIEDDGKGITKEIREKFFFKQIKGEESTGLGLGLYLVARIVKNYGGNITAKDSELGGAKFEIELNKASESYES